MFAQCGDRGGQRRVEAVEVQDLAEGGGSAAAGNAALAFAPHVRRDQGFPERLPLQCVGDARGDLSPADRRTPAFGSGRQRLRPRSDLRPPAGRVADGVRAERPVRVSGQRHDGRR